MGSGPVRTTLVAAVALTLLAVACGGGPNGEQGGKTAAPIQLEVASYIGASAPQMQALRFWADEVQNRSGGRLTTKFHYSGSLIGATDMLTGIAAGRADIGYMAEGYFPSQLPMTSVVEVPFNNSNAEAQARALMALYSSSAAFRSEYESQNLHVLFFPALGGNVIGSKAPIRSLDDLRGLRVRSLGLTGKALSTLGADPVSIPADQLYQSLSTGVVKAFSGFAFEVISAQKLQEVAPYVVDSGLGQYAASIIAMNKSRYEGLSADLKKIVDDASADAQAESVRQLAVAEKQVCADILKAGGRVGILDASDWRAKTSDSLRQLWIADHPSISGGAGKFLQEYNDQVARASQLSKYVPGAQACASGAGV